MYYRVHYTAQDSNVNLPYENFDSHNDAFAAGEEFAQVSGTDFHIERRFDEDDSEGDIDPSWESEPFDEDNVTECDGEDGLGYDE